VYNVLSNEFLEKYEDFSPNMNELGKFVYLRTYSRYLTSENRRENWKETVKRSVEFNIKQELDHLTRQGMPITKYKKQRIEQEAQMFFNSMYGLNQFLSGRTMWVGDSSNSGIQKFAMANFNCAYTKVEKWEDLGDLFYALLVGTGVGFGCRLENAEKLAPIRRFGYLVKFKDYNYIGFPGMISESSLSLSQDTATIVIGDSKEGWVGSLNIFLSLLTDKKYDYIKYITLDFDHVRPNGTPLKTFGGTASGPEPLKEMFEGILKVIRNEYDPDNLADPMIDGKNPAYVKVRPVHIMDIANLIGYNVVVGGVRRTAEIFLLDENDMESVFAKFGLNGLWTQEHYDKFTKIWDMIKASGMRYPEQRFYKMKDDFLSKGFYEGTGFHHRRMSNNSVAFIEKPAKEYVMLLGEMMQLEGEPGMINLYEAARRIFAAMGISNPGHESICEVAKEIGLNPCAEIILFSKGLCNLTTVNVKNFVKQENGKHVLDIQGLLNAQVLSARAGLRMTLIQLELPEWHRVQSTYRLTGCSLTGYQDALEMVGLTKEDEKALLAALRKVGQDAVNQYADELRIPAPLFVTAIKPEGTLSQVAGGVSPGLHFSHAPYYIRRIRINARDPLALAVKESGWTINPEVGTPGDTYEEQMKNARTLVIDFPIASGASRTKDDVSALEQFEIYKTFQKYYTDMNTSNTITVKPDEWTGLFEQIYEDWDQYVGVSFLALDGGTYQLAPYETITEEKYKELSAVHNPLRLDLLQEYDLKLYSELLDDTMEGCEAGVCPVR